MNFKIIKKYYAPFYIDHLDNYHVQSRVYEFIKKSIERKYTKFEKASNDYPFKIIIGFYLDALNQNYLEMKYMSSMTCLEAILNSFEEFYGHHNEKTMKNIIRDERYEKANEIISEVIGKELIQKNEGHKVEDINLENFKISNTKMSKIRNKGDLPELIDKIHYFEEYYGKVIDCDIKKVIYIRNKITHTGKIPKTYNDNEINSIEEYNALRNVLNSMITTIINSY